MPRPIQFLLSAILFYFMGLAFAYTLRWQFPTRTPLLDAIIDSIPWIFATGILVSTVSFHWYIEDQLVVSSRQLEEAKNFELRARELLSQIDNASAPLSTLHMQANDWISEILARMPLDLETKGRASRAKRKIENAPDSKVRKHVAGFQKELVRFIRIHSSKCQSVPAVLKPQEKDATKTGNGVTSR